MILDTIVARTRVTLEERQAAVPAETLRHRLAESPLPTDLAYVLQRQGVSIIAEIKRASPSKGLLNGDLEPADLAATYAAAGASAISVLTETDHFRGSLDDLQAARQGMARAGHRLPLLRKDFIVDRYQLLEARVYGADAALLIAAILDDSTLEQLFHAALSLGLTPLVEVHNRRELEQVLPLDPPLVGINNRNLEDFTVDLAVTESLRPCCRQAAPSSLRAASTIRSTWSGSRKWTSTRSSSGRPWSPRRTLARNCDSFGRPADERGEDLWPDQPGRCAVGRRQRR